MKGQEKFNVQSSGFEILKFDNKNYGLKFQVLSKEKGVSFAIVRMSSDELALLAFSALKDILNIRVIPQLTIAPDAQMGTDYEQSRE